MFGIQSKVTSNSTPTRTKLSESSDNSVFVAILYRNSQGVRFMDLSISLNAADIPLNKLRHPELTFIPDESTHWKLICHNI